MKLHETFKDRFAVNKLWFNLGGEHTYCFEQDWQGIGNIGCYRIGLELFNRYIANNSFRRSQCETTTNIS